MNVSNINGMLEAAGNNTRFSIVGECLVMGTVEQFSVGTYQCVVAQGVHAISASINALSMFLSMQYGY